MAWTNPRTWVATELLTAALMNLHVRDNLLYLKGDAAWTAPALSGTWVNYGSSNEVAGYRRIGDLVYLRGLIKSGTIATTAFTLPAGYRPAADLIFAVASNSAYGQLRVTPAGLVVPESGSAVAFALNCSFSVV